jgi:hypothetical protein
VRQDWLTATISQRLSAREQESHRQPGDLVVTVHLRMGSFKSLPWRAGSAECILPSRASCARRKSGSNFPESELRDGT